MLGETNEIIVKLQEALVEKGEEELVIRICSMN